MNDKSIHNDVSHNLLVPQTINDITNWHYDRNLIDGATSLTQTSKLLEEFTELVAAQFPDKNSNFLYAKLVEMLAELHSNGRIKPVPAKHAQEALKDAIGDMVVVQINIAEREGMSLEECMVSSYCEIKDRKGKMIDGKFVKEEDL